METIQDTGVYLPGIQWRPIVCEGQIGRKHPTIYFVLTVMYNNHLSTVAMCKVVVYRDMHMTTASESQSW